MLRRKFSGLVRTLADSCEADYLVTVICEECGARKQMHPYRLIARHKELARAPLGKPLAGFRCTSCRRRTRVVISCLWTHPGGF
jgi:hypothetical protein